MGGKMNNTSYLRLIIVCLCFLFVFFLFITTNTVPGLYLNSEAQKLSNIGQWYQFQWGVPVAAIGVLVTGFIAWAGFRIAERQGDVELLKFTHDRLSDVNSSAVTLASELEAYFSTTDQINKINHRRMKHLIEKIHAERTEKNMPLDEEEIKNEAFGRMTSDADASEKQIDELLNNLKSIRQSLRNLTRKPFALALLRKSHQRIQELGISEKINAMVGMSLLENDPQAIAQQVGAEYVQPYVTHKILQFYYGFEVPYFEPSFLAGLVSEHYFFFTKDRLKKQKIHAVLVNVGLANLTMLYALLPSRESVIQTLSQLLPEGRAAIKYADMSASSASDVLTADLRNEFEEVLKRPQDCVFVLTEDDDGNFMWRPYETKDGPFKSEDLWYAWIDEVIEQALERAKHV